MMENIYFTTINGTLVNNYEIAKATLKQMMDIYGEDNSLVKKGKFKLRMAGINLDDLH